MVALLLFLGFLLNDVHQTALESFLVLCKTVLLPSVVEHLLVEVMPLHASLKEANSGLVVGLLLKLEGSAVIHEFLELGWVSGAKLFKWRFHLLFLDGIVLLVFASSWETLPWKRSFEKVEKHMADSFQIVTPRLLDSFMGGDGSVSCRTSQVLSILVGNVLSLTVLVALRETKINNIDIIPRVLGCTNQEVIWLDIPMDDAFLMNFLDMADKLNCDM